MGFSHLTDTPMLTTLHNLLAPESKFIWSRYAGWYNTISAQQAEALPSLPRAKFAGVVHNSIDGASFPFEPEKDDYLLFLGRITPDKGVHLAIEAAQRAGSRIVIAGKI